MVQRIALVTGATGGIGSAVTQHLVTTGYTVIAVAQDQERLQKLQEADLKHVLPLPLNVGVSQSVWLASLMKVFEYYDIEARIDVLVCAHGAPPVTTPSLQLSMQDEFIPVVFTDLGGAFLAAQAVAPYMIRQHHGSIVFVSSLHAHHTYPARAAYAAAKAGICGMARSLALEWGGHGITVNTILPWQVAGIRSFYLAHKHEQETGEDLLSQYKAKNPQRRLVTEDEVAEAVLFLIRNRSCNGTELVLDGGVSASMWYKDF